MVVVINLFRVLFAGVWTAILGAPMLAVIYLRYVWGRLCAAIGRVDLLDRALEANARFAGWVAQRPWASVLFAICRIRVRVRELRPIDWARSHVICSNHASVFDILALAHVVPPPFRFVAKRELVKWPVIGWALRPAGQIVVDRADHAGALRSVAEAARRHIRGQVIFFVEGTRSRSGELQPFKKGAFHFAIANHLPVLPVAIAGSHEVLSKLPWWRMRPGRDIEIRFCPPIEPAAAETNAASVERLRSDTRAVIAAALGRETTATAQGV
jgi:1-acyl-sn-glycerol-3-phosphate acyltransferase